jgi:hypothetical protein
LDKNKVMAYLRSFPQKSVVVDISILYVRCNSFLDDQDIKLIGHSIKKHFFFRPIGRLNNFPSTDFGNGMFYKRQKLQKSHSNKDKRQS